MERLRREYRGRAVVSEYLQGAGHRPGPRRRSPKVEIDLDAVGGDLVARAPAVLMLGIARRQVGKYRSGAKERERQAGREEEDTENPTARRPQPFPFRHGMSFHAWNYIKNEGCAASRGYLTTISAGRAPKFGRTRTPRSAKTRPSAIFAGMTLRDDHFAIWKASVVLEARTNTTTSGAMNARL